MNLDEKYRAWKEQPTPVNVPPDFTGEVMRLVHLKAGQRQAQRYWSGVGEFFQRNVAFQYAALAVAAVAGVGRLWLIFFAILQP